MANYRHILVKICLVLVALSPIQGSLHHWFCHTHFLVSDEHLGAVNASNSISQGKKSASIGVCQCGHHHATKSDGKAGKSEGKAGTKPGKSQSHEPAMVAYDSPCQVCQLLAEPTQVHTYSLILASQPWSGMVANQPQSRVWLSPLYSQASPRAPPV